MPPTDQPPSWYGPSGWAAAHLIDVGGRNGFQAAAWSGVAIKAGGLEGVERLVGPQTAGQIAVAEHRAAGRMDAEEGPAAPTRLQSYQAPGWHTREHRRRTGVSDVTISIAVVRRSLRQWIAQVASQSTSESLMTRRGSGLYGARRPERQCPCAGGT